MTASKAVAVDASHPAAAGAAAAHYASPSVWYCVATCLLYGFGSGSLAFLNKGLVSSLGFTYSNALLTLQMLACVLLFWLARVVGWGWGRFSHPTPRPHRLWGRYTLLVRLLPLSIFFALNALGGLLSLQGLSLPMYSVLKRFTPVLVAGMEWALQGRRTTPRVALSLALCTGGFVLAGLGDLVFDAKAYALAMISCTSQAAYLMSVDRTGKELGLQSHELLYYNSLLSLLLFTPVVLATGELRAALTEYSGWSSPTFLLCLAAMILFGMSLNYFQFLCTQVNSPLTTCMTGVIKGIVTTIAGFFMFGGQPLTLLNLTGVALNTAGGAGYAWAKYAEKQEQQAAAKINAATAAQMQIKQAEMAKLLPHTPSSPHESP